MSTLAVKPMKLKILYTFDDNQASTCLTRTQNMVDVQVVHAQNQVSIGIVELRSCILSVLSASPELVSYLDYDFAVYSLDYTEEDMPFVGHGLLSWLILEAERPQQKHGPLARPQGELITGRICANVFAMIRSSSGLNSRESAETLEVKLRFTRVPNSSQLSPIRSIILYRTISEMIPESLDFHAWRGFMKSEPFVQSLVDKVVFPPEVLLAMDNQYETYAAAPIHPHSRPQRQPGSPAGNAAPSGVPPGAEYARSPLVAEQLTADLDLMLNSVPGGPLLGGFDDELPPKLKAELESSGDASLLLMDDEYFNAYLESPSAVPESVSESAVNGEITESATVGMTPASGTAPGTAKQPGKRTRKTKALPADEKAKRPTERKPRQPRSRKNAAKRTESLHEPPESSSVMVSPLHPDDHSTAMARSAAFSENNLSSPDLRALEESRNGDKQLGGDGKSGNMARETKRKAGQKPNGIGAVSAVEAGDVRSGKQKFKPHAASEPAKPEDNVTFVPGLFLPKHVLESKFRPTNIAQSIYLADYKARQEEKTQKARAASLEEIPNGSQSSASGVNRPVGEESQATPGAGTAKHSGFLFGDSEQQAWKPRISCENCGSTKSSSWRKRKVPGSEGKSYVLCSLCGRYLSSTKMLPPANLRRSEAETANNSNSSSSSSQTKRQKSQLNPEPSASRAKLLGAKSRGQPLPRSSASLSFSASSPISSDAAVRDSTSRRLSFNGPLSCRNLADRSGYASPMDHAMTDPIVLDSEALEENKENVAPKRLPVASIASVVGQTTLERSRTRYEAEGIRFKSYADLDFLPSRDSDTERGNSSVSKPAGGVAGRNLAVNMSGRKESSAKSDKATGRPSDSPRDSGNEKKVKTADLTAKTPLDSNNNEQNREWGVEFKGEMSNSPQKWMKGLFEEMEPSGLEMPEQTAPRMRSLTGASGVDEISGDSSTKLTVPPSSPPQPFHTGFYDNDMSHLAKLDPHQGSQDDGGSVSGDDLVSNATELVDGGEKAEFEDGDKTYKSSKDLPSTELTSHEDTISDDFLAVTDEFWSDVTRSPVAQKLASKNAHSSAIPIHHDDLGLNMNMDMNLGMEMLHFINNSHTEPDNGTSVRNTPDSK